MLFLLGAGSGRLRLEFVCWIEGFIAFGAIPGLAGHVGKCLRASACVWPLLASSAPTCLLCPRGHPALLPLQIGLVGFDVGLWSLLASLLKQTALGNGL